MSLSILLIVLHNVLANHQNVFQMKRQKHHQAYFGFLCIDSSHSLCVPFQNNMTPNRTTSIHAEFHVNFTRQKKKRGKAQSILFVRQ